MDANAAAVFAAVAAVASAIAAAVSVALLGVSTYFQWAAGRPRLRVSVNSKIPIGVPGIPELAVLTIDAKNRGRTPVTVDSAGFETRGGQRLALLSNHDSIGRLALPRRLEPGEAAEIAADFDVIRGWHARDPITVAYVTSAAGDRFRGNIPDKVLAPPTAGQDPRG